MSSLIAKDFVYIKKLTQRILICKSTEMENSEGIALITVPSVSRLVHNIILCKIEID